MFLKKAFVIMLAAMMVVNASVTTMAAEKGDSKEATEPAPSDGGGGSGGGGGGGGGSSSGGGGGGGGRAAGSTTSFTSSTPGGSVLGASRVNFDGLVPMDSSLSNTGANAGTWYYNPDTGDWKYQFNNGTGAVGWAQLPWTVNGQTQNLWYYFSADGTMMDGNQVIAGQNYYLNPESNGWRGGMVDAPANNASVEGMVTMGGNADSGAWNGTWYYSPSADNWKYLYSNGNVAIGWNQLSWTAGGVTRNDWYHFDHDGWMSSGLVKLYGNTYYLNPVSDGFKGAMITGTADVNGSKMTFADSGELLN